MQQAHPHAHTITLRRGQQRDLRDSWEVLAGVIAVIAADGHSVVGLAVRGDVVSAPKGYVLESLIDGTAIRRTDQQPEACKVLDFILLRSIRDAATRIAAVRAILGGVRITADDFGRICDLNPGTVRHHSWREALPDTG